MMKQVCTEVGASSILTLEIMAVEFSDDDAGEDMEFDNDDAGEKVDFGYENPGEHAEFGTDDEFVHNAPVSLHRNINIVLVKSKVCPFNAF